MNASSPAPRPPRPVLPVLAVVGGAAVVVVAYLLGVVSGRGRGLDERAMRAAEHVGGAVRTPVHLAIAFVGPAVVLVGTVVLVVRALRRDDRARAAAVLALVVGSEVVAQGVKLLLPRPGGGVNTLPSGHVTMIAGFLAALLLAEGWQRRAAVVAAVGAVAAGALGTMVIGWHRPSDVVAACGVVVMCAGFVDLLAPRWRRSSPAPVRGRTVPLDPPTVPTTPWPPRGAAWSGGPPAYPHRT